MKRVSEILESSRKRLEEKRKLAKEVGTKHSPPDYFELEEAREFLNLGDRAKQKFLEKDPAEYDRLIDLGNKVFGQWQRWFINQDKDAEHPFIKGLFCKRWKLPIGEYFKELEMEAMKERIESGVGESQKRIDGANK